jgi:MFS transporter, ACS family, hexuronate transporter
VVLYLVETLGLSLVVAGTMLGGAQLCGAAGRIAWGLVSDRLFQGRRTPALLLVGVIAILATVAVVLTSAQTPPLVIAAIVAILGLTLQGWNGLPHVLAPELAGTRAAGLAVGLVNSAGLAGVIVFPPLFGLLVDATGSYRVAWLAMILLLLAGLSALPWVHRAERALLSRASGSDC